MIRDEYLNPEVKKIIDEFNEKLDKRLDDKKSLLKTVPTLLILTITMTITTTALSQTTVLLPLMMNRVIYSPRTNQKQTKKKG